MAIANDVAEVAYIENSKLPYPEETRSIRNVSNVKSENNSNDIDRVVTEDPVSIIFFLLIKM